MSQRSASRQPQGIQSLETGGALLHVLVAGGGPLMLKDLAAQAGMPPAKAHRYLASFIRLGLVEQDASLGRYALGPFALTLGLAALGQLDAVRLATPLLPALAQELDATVAAAVWGNKGATIVRWEDSRDIVTVNVRAGGVMPLLRSATGRCFGAWLPEGRTAALLADELRADRNPPRAVPASPEAASRLWAKIRREGVSRVLGALIPGIDALSAPVFDHRNAMVLALTVLGYAGTVDCSPGGRVERTLKAAAADLSARLGKT